jgi:hypothetical protein
MTNKRTLTDIKLSADLTQAGVESVWGKPDGERGSGVAYLAYKLEDGQELWLQFLPEPPHRLRGALIVSPLTGEHKQVF